MPGLSPPATATSIVLPDGTEVGPGELNLLAGVGVVPRPHATDPAGIVIDGVGSEPDQPGALFLPGAVDVAPTVSLFTPGPDNYLRVAQAIIMGTTPAAGTDGSNYWAVRMAGSSSGQQDLPLSVEAQREYHYSAYDAASLGGLDGDNFSDSTVTGCACYDLLQPTADLTVVGLSTWADGSATFQAARHRYVLMPGDRSSYLAQTDWHTSLASETWLSHDLLTSVELSQGVTYAIGIEQESSSAAVSFGSGTRWGAGNDHVFSGSVADGGGNMMILDSGQGTSSIVTATAEGATFTRESEYEKMRYRLLGAPGGVSLGGDIAISTVSVGTPPNAPTDVQLLLQWTTEREAT